MYFIRTEETPEDALASLERGRSVQRWAFAGESLRTLLRYDLVEEEPYAAVRTLREVFPEDLSWFPDLATPKDLREALDILDDILEPGSDEEKTAAELLGYEPFENGWARYLEGLCALQEFETEPTPADFTTTLAGNLFRYLVCYEGERVGWDDADGGWPLFRPSRIVWIYDRGPDAPYTRRERY